MGPEKVDINLNLSPSTFCSDFPRGDTSALCTQASVGAKSCLGFQLRIILCKGLGWGSGCHVVECLIAQGNVLVVTSQDPTSQPRG